MKKVDLILVISISAFAVICMGGVLGGLIYLLKIMGIE